MRPTMYRAWAVHDLDAPTETIRRTDRDRDHAYEQHPAIVWVVRYRPVEVEERNEKDYRVSTGEMEGWWRAECLTGDGWVQYAEAELLPGGRVVERSWEQAQ